MILKGDYLGAYLLQLKSTASNGMDMQIPAVPSPDTTVRYGLLDFDFKKPITESIQMREAVMFSLACGIDVDKSTGQKQVMFRASNDNGQTFGKPVTVSGKS